MLHHASTPHGEDNNTKRRRAFGGLHGPFIEKYLHLFTLMIYLQYIQELLYNSASVSSDLLKNRRNTRKEWRPVLCNMISSKKILVTFLLHKKKKYIYLRGFSLRISYYTALAAILSFLFFFFFFAARRKNRLTRKRT